MEQHIKTIYTIGYSGFTVKEFLQELHRHNISVLIDVRSTPFSAYYTDYNKNNLQRYLEKEHIKYRNYASEFGARQENRNFYTSEGYLDFERFAKSESFLDGVKKISDGMKLGYVFSLMCAEKHPISCHRAILVARAFSTQGYRVVHLLPHGIELTQQDLEQQMLDMYYPARNQISLLEEAHSEAKLLADAYQLQNKKIGYHIEEV